MVFMGTSVAAATARAVVVATAMQTELGRIAGLIEAAGADEGTSLQQKLDSFGGVLVWATLGIVAVLFGLGLLRVLAGLPAPLLPIHLLWINLVTDGLPALCLATDPIDPDVMKQRPRARTGRITDGGFLRTMFFTGILTAGVSFGATSGRNWIFFRVWL